MDIFLTYSIAKLVKQTVNAHQWEHVIHASMAILFIITSVFNVLKRVEVYMGNAQDVALKQREQY
jgi:hypothetical protein